MLCTKSQGGNEWTAKGKLPLRKWRPDRRADCGEGRSRRRWRAELSNGSTTRLRRILIITPLASCSSHHTPSHIARCLTLPPQLPRPHAECGSRRCCPRTPSVGPSLHSSPRPRSWLRSCPRSYLYLRGGSSSSSIFYWQLTSLPSPAYGMSSSSARSWCGSCVLEQLRPPSSARGVGGIRPIPAPADRLDTKSCPLARTSSRQSPTDQREHGQQTASE